MHAYDDRSVADDPCGEARQRLFRQVSWDEALDFTAWKKCWISSRKYGPEAMVFFPPTSLSQGCSLRTAERLRLSQTTAHSEPVLQCHGDRLLLTYGVEEPGRNYEDVQYILGWSSKHDGSHLDL